MVESIPKHLLEKLSLLFAEFKSEEFSFQQAATALGQNERYTGQILSKLGHAGWIAKRRDKKDKRRKYYQINNFHDLLEKIGQKIQKEKINEPRQIK